MTHLPRPRSSSLLDLFTSVKKPVCRIFLCHSGLCLWVSQHLPHVHRLSPGVWGNSKHDWGKESSRFSSPHCMGGKQNNLLPHSDKKCPGWIQETAADREMFKRTFTQATKSCDCPIFLLPSTPSELPSHTFPSVHYHAVKAHICHSCASASHPPTLKLPGALCLPFVLVSSAPRARKAFSRWLTNREKTNSGFWRGWKSRICFSSQNNLSSGMCPREAERFLFIKGARKRRVSQLQAQQDGNWIKAKVLSLVLPQEAIVLYHFTPLIQVFISSPFLRTPKVSKCHRLTAEPGPTSWLVFVPSLREHYGDHRGHAQWCSRHPP